MLNFFLAIRFGPSFAQNKFSWYTEKVYQHILTYLSLKCCEKLCMILQCSNVLLYEDNNIIGALVTDIIQSITIFQVIGKNALHVTVHVIELFSRI